MSDAYPIPILHVTSAGDMGEVAGPLVRDRIARGVRDSGSCRIGLSGGSTPGPLLDWLAVHLPEELFSGCKITWVDERCLPRDTLRPQDDWTSYHADSNARLAGARWLGRARGRARDVLPMCSTGVLEPDQRVFESAFAERFDQTLDLALLGAGPDGHIASLFPGHPGLETSGISLAITDAPKPPPERLSLTMEVLAGSGSVVLLAKGREKAEVLRRAYEGDMSLPLGRLVREHGHRMHWVLDDAAASQLS
ncbi:MAG: 6-phosphogluconolactonase [Myxococcota bacterium]